MGTYGRVLAMSGKVEEAKEQLRRALEIAEEKNREELIEQVGVKQACQHFRTSYSLDLVILGPTREELGRISNLEASILPRDAIIF